MAGVGGIWGSSEPWRISALLLCQQGVLAGARCGNFVAGDVMFVAGHLSRKKLTGRNSDSFVFIIGWS